MREWSGWLNSEKQRGEIGALSKSFVGRDEVRGSKGKRSVSAADSHGGGHFRIRVRTGVRPAEHCGWEAQGVLGGGAGCPGRRHWLNS